MISASAWIICFFTKYNYVSGDGKSRKRVLIPHTKTSNLVLFDDLRDLKEISHQWWPNTLYNIDYTALLVSLLKLFYVINDNLLMLFCAFYLVPCRTRVKHWKYRTGWNHARSRLLYFSTMTLNRTDLHVSNIYNSFIWISIISLGWDSVDTKYDNTLYQHLYN